MLLFVWLAIFVNWNLDRRAREVFSANRAVEVERAKAEELLYNVLPRSVAMRLRSGEAVADSFSDVSVIFADVVGFSQLAKTLSPGHLVSLLNRFFSIADQCAERRGIEKVKTIGDAYLAVANGTASAGCGACEAVAFGTDLVVAMRELAEATGIDIQLRVGIHTGPVVGGVVGERRLTYDYWGDTMNIASRIESAARPGAVAVSSATFFQCAKLYEFGEPEVVTLKGVGETRVYHLAA